MASKLKDTGKRILGYEEQPPVVSSRDWVKGLVGNNVGSSSLHYLRRLFPIFQWAPRYNFGWALGDLVAGLTVGLVIVPQGMSYALIATLPAEYGLYSSFVGLLFYCLFATSKDVSIGPVAVMSLTVAQIIKHVETTHPGEFSRVDIATGLSFICGFIVLGIGLLRLGWLVEFISAPAVAGFMTGSAVSIVCGQIAGLLGISGVDTRAATYKVIINTLKALPRAKLDAAFGVTGLFALYAIRSLCIWLTKRFPRRARLLFFLSVLRNAFVMVVLTLAAWLYCRDHADSKGKYPIKILLTVPPGLQHVQPPNINGRLVSALAGQLPVATVILLLEHIAISKSFGRLNGYKIDPNQELIAIGVTNTIGSCFGAYPATGSFSRSALKSKSGVRTPAAGIVTAVVVILALYALTPAFFWIPSAGLSALIIHAVADLVASPSQVWSYWLVSPLEFLIFVAAVLVTVFSSIENGIYTSIAASLALLLIRVAHPRGSFLGRVTLRGDRDSDVTRDVYVPLKGDGVTSSDVFVAPPPAGVLVYRHEESFLYPNSSILNSVLVDKVRAEMRRGKDMSNVKPSERPWNDPGRPGRQAALDEQEANILRPDLFAVVLDFSAISQIDTTAVQALIDARNEIERWTDHPVEFHFATILSPWIRRALIAGGFGTGQPASRDHGEIASIVPYRGGRRGTPTDDAPRGEDLEAKGGESSATNFAPLLPTETPFFHFDLAGAVCAAEVGLDYSLKSTPRKASLSDSA